MPIELYRQELNHLLAEATRFGQERPALAPFLATKSADPDVERLLEGVAYLAAVVRRRVNEGFPELAEALMDLLFPEVSQTLPALTLMRFQPAPGFKESQIVPYGAVLAAVPVNSVRARFALTESVAIWPAIVARARLIKVSGVPNAGLELKVDAAAPLSDWIKDSLVIYLAGEFGEAADRRDWLLTRTKGLEVAAGSLTYPLPLTALSPAGVLATNSALLSPNAASQPRSSGPFLGAGLIREYFAFPEKFLFVRVSGLGPLKNAGDNSLTLRFFFKEPLKNPPPVKPEHFVLNVAPAVNLVTRAAHPIRLDHRREEYLVRPQRSETEKLAINRVVKVVGLSTTGQEREYRPFSGYGSIGTGYYALRHGGLTGEDLYLKVIYPKGSKPPEPETLSLELECYNREITDFLGPGDIAFPTEKSPAMALFSNLVKPSKVAPAPAAEGALWRILSCLHLSLSPLSSAESLRDILALYAPPLDADPTRQIGVKQKIEALVDLTAETLDFFVRGWPARGTKLSLLIDGSRFASPGEIGLFGDVLERFLIDFLPLNSALALSLIDKNSKETRAWPIRLGLKKIL
ncbi:MAG: type VI secretion system baseplate subunit TssF [Deltaproteobacteria bacterium]|jgi:type VI secretion system protein ImpG|nr:type VI secretion system baseplate subunit TssF [Deltaproteobacteria bacterium]